ncbi:MAG TPA: hypothetical protein VGK38_11360 [Prolixibacteraceae bacterium]|jgi:hypothetical protein
MKKINVVRKFLQSNYPKSFNWDLLGTPLGVGGKAEEILNQAALNKSIVKENL